MAEIDDIAFKAMNNATTSPSDSLMMGTDWAKQLSDKGLGIEEFSSLYKKRWGSLDKESYAQVESSYDPEYYKSLEDQGFPKDITDAIMKDAGTYMDEMRSGIDLKKTRSDEFKISPYGNGALGSLEKKKTKGLKGFFQRLLPGGKTGYNGGQ
tara:strand:- start:106 stop:564 length:459 start_codon:yes stop_codon:yes gene_type:complete